MSIAPTPAGERSVSAVPAVTAPLVGADGSGHCLNGTEHDAVGGATRGAYGDAPRAGAGQRTIVALLAAVPVLAGGFAVVRLWSHGIGWLDLILASVMYLVTGLGVTVGFHRLLTHRSFRPSRWLKVVLAVAGTMAIQGSVISWVSQHRRHHVFSDRTGDPHSPVRPPGAGLVERARGLWHAHTGWLFRRNPVDAERWSADLLADKDIRLVSAMTPVVMAASLLIPFVVGWAATGTLVGGLLALLWAGLVRILLLHHATWSINSICHAFGRQPFRTRDQSRDVAALALVSFGESWHNAHHAFPNLARHGVGPGQIDMSAAVIRIFERLGWATDVCWPTPELLARRRVVPLSC
ncbi:MAG: acyl-CoA desaturase [Actinomycetota bacterium]|nr:acyl-CoA desaturase [Actinomycetota bacterium]